MPKNKTQKNINKEVDKKIKGIKKKVRKKSKKTSSNKRFFVSLFILILIGAFFVLWERGYFDNLLEVEKIEYGSNQNEEGFYYYNELGMGSKEYYEGTKGLIGEELEKKITRIISDTFSEISYGDARYVLEISDRDPKNPENVIGIYDSDVIANYWIGKGEGAWQREHVWPNSKLGIERVNEFSINQGSDLHNLRAITGINQTRSNRYFEDGKGKAKTVGSEGFYPGDDHKGDVARILFYMSTRYEFLNLTNDENLLKNNPATNYTMEGTYAGKLDLLIRWHKEDPVDDFERQRNDFIQNCEIMSPIGNKIYGQANRNPFIDHPEFVHLIWEGKTIEDITQPIEIPDEEVVLVYEVYVVAYLPRKEELAF